MNLLHNPPRLRQSAVLIAYIFAASSANAATTPLENILPELTPLQATTGAAVQKTCFGLIPTNQITPNPQTAQQDLFNQCSGMVSNTLELSNTGMGSALQNVATEEMATPSKISTNTLSGQVSAINSHLFELHNLGGGSGDDALLSKRFSTFVNGVGGFGDIKATTQENAANFNNAGVILGADYRITDNFLVGLAGGYTHIKSDYTPNTNVAGGGVNADVFNVSVFSTYDINNFYVDGSFSYGWSDYNTKRGVIIQSNNKNSPDAQGANRTATANPNGEQYSTALGVGYNFHKDALNISPVARVNYFHGKIDSYSEQGAFGLNLDVNKQNFESLQSSIGGQISYALSQSFGVITPQLSFTYNHEFMNDSRNITAKFSADPNNFTFNATTNSPDRDFFVLGTGVSSVLQGGVQLFFNYQTLLGYNRVTSHGFTGGVKLEF